MENSELITKALRYINSEYKKTGITVEDVANHAGFSTDYFNRIFFAHTGFNVMEYVRFSRLKIAAWLLRTCDTDILSIALDCGYESHESFSRAFKNQYGITPSEYRMKYEKSEAFYGDFNNDTIGARLLHEFNGFKIADSDEVIDYMLETDALRYGYTAICFRTNGGVALYKGQDFREGFVWFTEWDNGKFEGDIICDNWEITADFIKTFSGERFDMIVYTLKNDDFIKSELKKYDVKINGIKRRPINIYTESPYYLNTPNGFSMGLLTFKDYDLILRYFEEKYHDSYKNRPRLKHLKHELYIRDILGNDQHSVFMFGIFHKDHLIGISDGALQRTHGFVVNNCIVTSILPEYESEELYQFAFKFVTNAALEKGALPIDDTQTPDTADENRSGSFDSTELGYKAITDICIIN